MPQILSCVSDFVAFLVGCHWNSPPAGSKTGDAGLPWDDCERNSHPKQLGTSGYEPCPLVLLHRFPQRRLGIDG